MCRTATSPVLLNCISFSALEYSTTTALRCYWIAKCPAGARQEAETQREGEHATAVGRRTDATTATDATAARAEKAILPQPQPRRAKGAPSSRSPSPSPSPEILPLTTLGELLSYEGPGWGQGFAPARPLPFVASPFPPLKSRLLVCHDLAGGYGQDRLVQGGGYDRPYRAYDWGLIDIFVYFRCVCRTCMHKRSHVLS